MHQMMKYLNHQERMEAPALGMIAGALIGGGGTLAGMLSVGGLMGGLIGAVGGSLLGGSMGGMDAPRVQAPATPQTPATPSVPGMPGSTPGSSGGGDTAPLTAEEIAQGQTTGKPRRGRVSTILTPPGSRGIPEGETQEIERLGG